MNKFNEITICTNASSSPDRGPSAAGLILANLAGAVLVAKGVFIGNTTCNAAEYHAMICGLNAARLRGATKVKLRSCSQLLIHQVTGICRVKNPQLRLLHFKVLKLLQKFSSYTITKVSHKDVIPAHRLAKKAVLLKGDVVETDGKTRIAS